MNDELYAMNQIIIPLNKTKSTRYFLGSLLLCVFGILFITTPEWFIRSDNPTVIKIVGYILVILFGAFTLLFSQRVFDKKPAMVLDDEGFIDNTSGVNTGKVLWTDVTDVFVKEGMGQKFIMLKVKNPQTYIEREKNPLKIRIMDMNNRLYQTPINISAKGMRISFDDLHQLINKKFMEHSS